MPQFSPRLCHLADIAGRAAQIAVEAKRAMQREFKPDGSIVTNGDRAVETFLRDVLPQLAPGSTVWGEEFGISEEGPGGLWVVDPIDGTSNFAYGSPLWAVSIALIKGETIEVGAVVLPELHETYLAELGEGSYLNGERIKPIPPGPIRAEELISYGENLATIYGNDAFPGKQRLSGSAVMEGVFMATQRYRAVIGLREKLYDIGACVLIAREAGAEFRYANGEPFLLEGVKRDEKIGQPWALLPRESGLLLPWPA